MINKTCLILLLIGSTYGAAVLASPFPHHSIFSVSEMKAPMMTVHTETYAFYTENLKDAVSAEWVTQTGPMGKSRTLNLSKKGFVYALDLDSKHCTKTDIRELMNAELDPEQAASEMKKQMNLTQEGDCEGAGLQGIKYSSSFGSMCFYKDVFLLWQEAMGTRMTVTQVEFDRELPKDKIRLPSDVTCIEGPDLSQGIQGLMPTAAGQAETEVPPNQPQTQDREKAMKQAQEAMKQLGDFFKQN